MSNENLKPREELRNSFYEHYKTLTEEKNGVSVFYFGKTKTIPVPDDINVEVINPFGATVMTAHVKSNLTEDGFYERLNELETIGDFICYVGENHPFVFEFNEKINSEEYKEYVENNLKKL
jgi:hypothetical protein